MDGQPPQEEDFSTLSIDERLAHKNWKARVSAYESLVKTFQLTASDTDPAFKPYTSSPDLLKKIVTDSNAVAQEKGVECVVAFVKYAGENAARTREAVVPALVDKCFGSTRAGTKNQAIELVLQYVEVENSGAGVVVRSPTDPEAGILTHLLHSGQCITRLVSKAAKSCRWNSYCLKGDRPVSCMLLPCVASMSRSSRGRPMSSSNSRRSGMIYDPLFTLQFTIRYYVAAFVAYTCTIPQTIRYAGDSTGAYPQSNAQNLRPFG